MGPCMLQAEVLKVRETKKAAVIRRRQADIDYDNALTQQAAERGEREIKESQAALEAAEALVEPPPPEEEEENDDVDEIPEIFFTGPKQLLEKYKEMEGKNLFLIQNVQVRFITSLWHLPAPKQLYTRPTQPIESATLKQPARRNVFNQWPAGMPLSHFRWL